MPTNVNIGGASGKTWASVRAPVFKGTGYSGTSMPYQNENWKTARSAGYPNNVTDLQRAFPFYKDNNSFPALSASTGIGLKGGYLNFGAGKYYGITLGEVENGNNYTVSSTDFGYDHESLKALLVGATVELTYQRVFPLPAGPVTTTVTVTTDMFPADVQSGGNGVFVTTDTYNDYTINSVTLP